MRKVNGFKRNLTKTCIPVTKVSNGMVTAMGGWVGNLGLFPKKQIGDVRVWLT